MVDEAPGAAGNRHLPVLVHATPIWVAAGLLAPVALGLPLGVAARAVVGGTPAPAGNGLQGWVYAVVYGGFLTRALGLPVAFLGHARAWWPRLFALRTAQLPDLATPPPRAGMPPLAAPPFSQVRP